MQTIFFLGGARDYQAVDWYKAIKEVCDSKRVVFVTDSLSSEGYEQLISNEEEIINLVNIDRFLLSSQSKFGNVWRNIVKLLVFPFQSLCLNKIAKKNPGAIFHAHTIYFMFLCWTARVKYLGRPQGDEILIRTKNSRLYRYFAIKSLLGAKHIIVDSKNMQKRIQELCSKEACFIQNWLDIDAISLVTSNISKREKVVSIRAITELYRIDRILDAREVSSNKPPLLFIYPFVENTYRVNEFKRLEKSDEDMGRIARKEMYRVLNSTKLVISIPSSDSSPRSVYESIFCGCCVAVTYNPWIESLPECMQKRLVIIDINNRHWMDKALEQAKIVISTPYKPSAAALDIFDQRRTIKFIESNFY